MTRRQCAKCPWKVTTDPRTIPGGYSADKHRALARTIAPSGSFQTGPIRVMACHESKIGAEVPCVGWVANQLGPGNNLALRLRACRDKSLLDFELDGEQHERFDQTLPMTEQEQDCPSCGESNPTATSPCPRCDTMRCTACDMGVGVAECGACCDEDESDE